MMHGLRAAADFPTPYIHPCKWQVLNWKMWPVAQYVNFNFIPPELQLLYMNVVALFWTIGLSIIMN